jgi:hypothetical protein
MTGFRVEAVKRPHSQGRGDAVLMVFCGLCDGFVHAAPAATDLDIDAWLDGHTCPPATPAPLASWPEAAPYATMPWADRG